MVSSTADLESPHVGFASANKATSWWSIETVLLLGIAATIASFPLSWIELATFAGKRLRPMHLTVSFLFFACLAPRVWRFKPAAINADILALFVFYSGFLVVSAFSMLPAHNNASGVNQLAKAMIYFGCFIVATRVLTLLIHDAEQKLCLAVYFGCAAGTVLFLGLATYVFASQGRNLAFEYVAAIRSGSFGQLFRGFYPLLFNWGSSGQVNLQPDDADYVATHLRHTIMGAFILNFTILRAIDRAVTEVSYSKWLRMGSWILQAFAVFVVVASISRSAIISIGGVIAGGLTLSSLRRREWGVRPELLAVGLALLLGFGYVAVNYLGGMSELLQDRFSNLDENPRLAMYEYAVREIADRPFLGHGFGTRLDYHTSLRVHNFLLAAWYEGGLLSFFLAGLFLLAGVFVWLRCWTKVFLRWEWGLRLDPAWILMLPFWPFVRTMVAGDGGLPAFVDWICLAFFLAAVAVSTSLYNVNPGRCSDS